MKKLIYKTAILLIISLTAFSSCKTFKCNEMLNSNKVKSSEQSQNTTKQPTENIVINSLPKEDLPIENKSTSLTNSKDSYSIKSNSGIAGKSSVISTLRKKNIYNALKATIYTKKENHARTADDQRKVEGLGLAGFIIGIVGWFMPFGIGLVMCLLAIIFGAISLGKISNNPEKYKGKGFAITSLILGIAGVGILLWLLSLVL